MVGVWSGHVPLDLSRLWGSGCSTCPRQQHMWRLQLTKQACDIRSYALLCYLTEPALSTLCAGSTGLLMTSPLAKQLPQQLLQQLPAWLLQLLSAEEWQSLMRLSIFPAGFSLRDAAHVLPSAGILPLPCCSSIIGSNCNDHIVKSVKSSFAFLGRARSCACSTTQWHAMQFSFLVCLSEFP